MNNLNLPHSKPITDSWYWQFVLLGITLAIRFCVDQIPAKFEDCVRYAWINSHVCWLFAGRLFVYHFRFTGNERQEFRGDFENAGRIMNIVSADS